MIMVEQTRRKERKLVFGFDNRGLRDNAGWLYHSGARAHYEVAWPGCERQGAAGRAALQCTLLTHSNAHRGCSRDEGNQEETSKKLSWHSLTIIFSDHVMSIWSLSWKVISARWIVCLDKKYVKHRHIEHSNHWVKHQNSASTTCSIAFPPH